MLAWFGQDARVRDRVGWQNYESLLSCWQGIQGVLQDVTSKRELLSAYVGDFCKATRATCRILDVELKTNLLIVCLDMMRI